MDKNMTLEKRIAAELYSYQGKMSVFVDDLHGLSLIHISEPTSPY